MAIDWPTLVVTAVLSATVSWVTASTVAGRSERGRQAFEARRAVRDEAGPTGFGLARFLAAEGIECQVGAPSKLQRPSGDRIRAGLAG